MNNIANFFNLDLFFKENGVNQDMETMKWFKNIAGSKISQFKYENLPNDIPSYVLQQALFYRNKLCLYQHPVLGVVLCTYLPGSDYDLYWQPKKVDLLSLSGKTIAVKVDFKDLILIKDNELDIPPFLIVNEWCKNIVDKEKTLNILNVLVRMPTLLTGDKTSVAALKQMLKKALNYEGFAFTSKGFSQKLEQFNITLPVKPLEMYELITKYYQLANNAVGIYSSESKAERVLTGEVASQNDVVNSIYEESLLLARDWIEKANSQFGCNIELIENYVENVKEDNQLMPNIGQPQLEPNNKEEDSISGK